MKTKIFLLTFLTIFASWVYAQSNHPNAFQINWKGVEKWYAGSKHTKFITFDDAKYPLENRLPYFIKKIKCDSASFYNLELKNPTYIPVTTEENEIIGDNVIPNEIEIQCTPTSIDEKNYIEVQTLPFINKDGKLLKLTSFNLELVKNTQKQKVASAITARSYSQSSVLSQGKFVQVRISESGVYKLTFEELNAMGLNPNDVKIYGYGGAVLSQNLADPKIDDLPELSIYMNKGLDGVFNSGDYILFYGQGVTKWSYNKANAMFNHTLNPYSKYGYYFVTSSTSTPAKRISEKTLPTASGTTTTITEFTDYQVHEKESLNLIESGKEFYGEVFNDVNSYNFTFNFPNPVATKTTTTRLDVAAAASAVSNFSLSLNGTQTQTLAVPARSGDMYERAKASNGKFKFTPDSETFNFNLSHIKPAASPSAFGYLNYLEVNVRRQLKMVGSAMQFQNVDNLDTNSFNQYQLSNANGSIEIWDITDQQNISKVPTKLTDGVINFTESGNTLKHYLAIDPSASNSFTTPTIIGAIPNQNLHSIAQADMVIITHSNFQAQAQKLAQAHREKDNMTVEVVTNEQVFNEFSSGTPDATAYRWIMKMLYDRASIKTDLPKYLLLFGRGTYDNRKLFTNSGDNFILTYQANNSLVTTLSYVTDDYFGILKDNQGIQITSDSLNLGIGRLPVTTVQQATDVVNKIVGYMSNPNKGNWKNQLCFLADDGDGALHTIQADTIASSINKRYPAFQVAKIYLDAYQQEVTASGQSYPLAKSRFQNLMRSGLFLLDYTGHAGPSGWGDESILSIGDVKALSNKNLPIFVGATCDFLQFDVQIVSGGEEVLLNPAGGGIGILSAARPVYSSQNLTLNKYFCENLFKKKNGEHMRVGDAVMIAKNSIGPEINKLAYFLMGDPALRLNYPTKYSVLTKSINESISLGNDTLRALSVATIKGIVADGSGNKVSNFNGTIHTTVFDKIQKIATLNNEKDGFMTYSDRSNTLFSGEAVVKNGEFNISFMLPKDIKYNYGTGRINYYAKDETNDFEAQGYFENFVVGGTNPNYTVETEGPSVELFLNSSNFISENKVNETPLFIANVSDANGINTVGSGIGHDIMLTIDKDPSQSYILNDYFYTAENSFSTGTINFKLPEMPNGKHTLTFRVWDLLNNSTTSSLNFEVVKGLTPTIFSVSNYPNPVKTKTNIVIEHDRPETVLNTSVEIFDISGRKVWSFSHASANDISWDLVSNEGIKVKTGVYFYRVNIKTKNSDMFSKTNKMLIIEQ